MEVYYLWRAKSALAAYLRLVQNGGSKRGELIQVDLQWRDWRYIILYLALWWRAAERGFPCRSIGESQKILVFTRWMVRACIGNLILLIRYRLLLFTKYRYFPLKYHKDVGSIPQYWNWTADRCDYHNLVFKQFTNSPHGGAGFVVGRLIVEVVSLVNF